MNTISELLQHYGLSLSDCNEDWADMVNEFQRVKSAMPAHVAQQREKEIIDEFLNYHDVTDDNPEPPEPVKTDKKESSKKGPRGTKAAKPQPHVFDEQSLFDKADSILEDLI